MKWITIKEACRLTGKSESTIRRLIRCKRLPVEKRNIGKMKRTYVDRHVLLETMSKNSATSPNHAPVMTAIHDPVKIMADRLSDKEYQVKYLQERLDRSEKENERLRDEIKALNSEIKGLLRGRETQTPKTIAGYLVNKLSNFLE